MFRVRREVLCFARHGGLGMAVRRSVSRRNSAIAAPDAELNDGICLLLIKIEHRSLRLFGIALAAACFLGATAPSQAGPYLLVEVESGRVIAESDGGKPWYPASVTKLMTTYVAFQAMRDRKIEPLTLLTVSANAMAQPPSKMGFKTGTEVTLDNALKMLMVRSANDIAVVVAEGVAGSVESFVHEMNRTAGRLGMNGTRFLNPHGLPEENQVTTARDMAILSRALIRDFPEYEFYFRIPAIQIGKRVIRNHNRLIDRYPGADGMKTGFICSSGFNMVAGAKRDGKRMLAVVFGSYSAAQRAEDAARLLERGFRREIADNQYGLLEAVRNIGGDPHDMRDEMCNPKRRRPAAESVLDEEDGDIDESADENASSKGKQAKRTKQPRQSLLGDLTPSMPPIRVFTGPPQKVPEDGIVALPAKADNAAKPAKAEKAKAEMPKPVQASAPAAPAPAKTKEPQKPAQPKK
jgi:D-alanyl-D-alanine carboxypeptidase